MSCLLEGTLPERSLHGRNILMIDDDSVRLREMALVVKWLFGPPGLHIRDYMETLDVSTTHKPSQEETQHGTVRDLRAAVQPRRRG